MQIGIKMNELKVFIVKMNKYDIFWWFFNFLYQILYTSAKTIFLRYQAICFENCYIVHFELDVLVNLVFFS